MEGLKNQIEGLRKDYLHQIEELRKDMLAQGSELHNELDDLNKRLLDETEERECEAALIKDGLKTLKHKINDIIKRLNDAYKIVLRCSHTLVDHRLLPWVGANKVPLSKNPGESLPVREYIEELPWHM